MTFGTKGLSADFLAMGCGVRPSARGSYTHGVYIETPIKRPL